MAIGKASDFKIYDEQFYGGQMEASVSAFPLFNAAVRNTIVLENRFVRGNYEYESFLDHIDLIARRDVTSVSAQTATAMTQDEFIGVKVHRKGKLIEQTRDAWMRIGSSPQEMSRILGRKYETEKMKDMVFTALLCVEAALANSANDVSYDATAGSTTTMTPGNLGLALAKFGDASQDVVQWMTHSTPWHDYRQQGITDKVNDIYRGVLDAYEIPGLGRPFGVIDADALIDGSGSTATYNVLGLVPGAVVVTQSEPDEILFERVGGLENITYRFQAEYALNIRVKGFQWDVTNGGSTPTDATLGTSTNWDLVVASIKNACGVRLKINSSND